MFDRHRKGQELYAATWRVLRSDRRLLVWPAVLVVLSMGVSIGAFLVASQIIDVEAHARLGMTLTFVIAGYPVALATFFCGVALAGTLNEVLEGRPADPRVGWQLARRRIGVILAWSIVVGTVGAVLRLLEQRVPLGGKIVALVADVGWSIATLFAVPVLAFEGHGPLTTVKRSTAIVRERFGAAVGGTIATAAIGLVVVIPALVLLSVGFAMANTAGAVLVAIALALILAMVAWQTAMDHAFRVILYGSVMGRLAPELSPAIAALTNPAAGWFVLDEPERGGTSSAGPGPRRTAWFSKNPDDFR